MDKLTLISGTLFISSNIFAILALILPDWIVTDTAGMNRFGLLSSCTTIYGREMTCIFPKLPIEWIITLFLIITGILTISLTVVLLVLSSVGPRNGRVINFARWTGFTGMMLFCFAAIVFPMGFHEPSIGGESYQLPSSHQVGISYIFFVLSIWISVVSELFAGKVCMPHF